MSNYYDPSLTMGQRIMNHKFAKMSIWEFLGWKPKEQGMTYREFEDERWRRKEERDRQAHEQQLIRQRTSNELQKISIYAQSCTNVMFMIADEFAAKPEWDEAWKAWCLDESAIAYLPLCYGEVLKKMKADNKYLPSTHMMLI